MKNESQNYQDNCRLIRSYGRIKSRKLSDHKKFLLENLLPIYEIKESLAHDYKKISCEIGFGFGDFLFEKAKMNQEQLFLGCEPHLNGVVNLLAKLEIEPLKNIKISREDARILLTKFPMNFFDELYILFPDPWPKIKHFKRRLIDVECLDFIADKLKIGGKLTIATDHDSYKTWILVAILKSSKLNWEATSKHDWQKFPDDWITTKYQKKALTENRQSVIFNLTKC